MEIVILIIIGVLCLAMAISVISQDIKNSAHKLFFISSVLVTLYSITTVIFLSAETVAESDFILRISTALAALLPLSMCVLAANFPHEAKKQPWIFYCLYGFSGLLLVIMGNIVFSHSVPFIDNFQSLGDSLEIKTFLTLFAVYFELGVITSISFNVKGLKRYNNRFEKDNLQIFLKILIASAIVIGIIFNFIHIVFLNGYNLSIYGTLSVAILLTTYALGFWRLGFYDYYPAFLRTVAYILSGISIVALYFLFEAIVLKSGVNNNFSSATGIIVILALTAIFNPILEFVTKILSETFDRRQNIDKFLTQLNSNLAQNTDIDTLLKRLAKDISSILRSKNVQFYVKYGLEKEKILHISSSKSVKLPNKDIIELEEFTESTSEIIYSIADINHSQEKIWRMFKSHNWSMVMPLRSDDQVIGFLLISMPKRSRYRAHDVNIIKDSYNNIMIAINSAVTIHSVRDMNSTLEQRIKNATKDLRRANSHLQKIDETKDDFISMASHQLRTPLTSIKGYVSMILDGDTGKITKTQRHFLSEAFTSSERMVHLINDFLNVSRLQTGRFILEKSTKDLVSITKDELESLKNSAKTRELELIFETNEAEILMNLDFDKLRQVIMNLIDNAIYYSKPKSVVTVKLVRLKNRVELTVEDAGIGVPEGEQIGLFTRFYRASNARRQRPDGTGVGLYLAQKVVSAHQGDVIFKSTEGEGSTFGFWLPIENGR